MTIGQIKSFLTVVNEQSFGKAASALFVTQPAISKSIAALENELGFQLLDRKNGMLSLTQEGQKMYDLFSRMENDYLAAVAEIRRIRENSSETIRIGCPDTWNPGKFYDRMVARFQERYPSVQLEIFGERVPDLLGKLQNGKLDFIMTYELQRSLQNGMSVRPLTKIGCRVIFAKKYYPEVKGLSDLNGKNLLVFDVDAEKQFGRIVRKTCTEYGFSPVIVNCNRLETALFNMACGKGIMLFTEWDDIIKDRQFISLDFPQYADVMLVFQSASEKPGIELFADELARIFAE